MMRVPKLKRIVIKKNPNKIETIANYTFYFSNGDTLDSVEAYCSYYYSKTNNRLVADTVYRKLKKYLADNGNLDGITNDYFISRKYFHYRGYRYGSLKEFVKLKLGDGMYSKFNSKRQYLQKKHPVYSTEELIEATLDALN